MYGKSRFTQAELQGWLQAAREEARGGVEGGRGGTAVAGGEGEEEETVAREAKRRLVLGKMLSRPTATSVNATCSPQEG